MKFPENREDIRESADFFSLGGLVVTPLAAQAFGGFIRDDLKAWAEFVAAAKIRLE